MIGVADLPNGCTGRFRPGRRRRGPYRRNRTGGLATVRVQGLRLAGRFYPGGLLEAGSRRGGATGGGVSSAPPPGGGRRAAAGAPAGDRHHPQDVLLGTGSGTRPSRRGRRAGWVRWPFALTTGGVLLGLYVLVSLALFLFAQRDLFAEMNLRSLSSVSWRRCRPICARRCRTSAGCRPPTDSCCRGAACWARCFGRRSGRAPPSRPPPVTSPTGYRADPDRHRRSGRGAARRRDPRHRAPAVRARLADAAVAGHGRRCGRRLREAP